MRLGLTRYLALSHPLEGAEEEMKTQALHLQQVGLVVAVAGTVNQVLLVIHHL